jgi:HK97 family phage major capsid protein
MTIAELLQRKGELVTQANEVLAAMGDQPRAEDEAKFDAIHVDIDKITKQVERQQKQEDVTLSLESKGRRSDPPQPGGGGTRGTGVITPRERDRAFRTWLMAGTLDAPEISTEDRDFAKRCGFDVTAKSVRFPMFAPQPLRSLRDEDVRAWRDEQRAALTGAQGTTTTGGYTVSDGAMQALEVALLQFGAMRSVAKIVRTATGGPLPFPTTNDTTQKGRLLSENTGATETEMTFGQLTLDAYKYSSDYILASVEFIQDSSIDVGAFIGSALGTRIGRLQNDHFTTGTGSSQPNGVVTAATSGVTGTSDPPTYANIVDLLHSVDPAYRDNAKFMMHDSTLKSIKKILVPNFSGQTDGPPLWQPGLVQGQPDMILGYRYVINQSMAAPGSTAKKMLFGDFSKYLIREVRDVTILRLEERFAELHQVAFLAFARADGDLLDAGTHPIKYMQQT